MKASFTIEPLTAETSDEANEMRLQSWLDTYVNEQTGITRTWIENRNAQQRSPERRQRRLDRLSDPAYAAWTASVDDKIIGVVTPYIDDKGCQHVGSLYVDKAWHGKGVGSALIRKVFEWADPAKPIELGVVTYNRRAIAFYKKHGFVAVPSSETLFSDMIPEFRMIRPASL